jgi:hypothetical protein
MNVETRAFVHTKRLLLFRVLNTLGKKRPILVKSSKCHINVMLMGGQIAILMEAPQGFECAYERKNYM